MASSSSSSALTSGVGRELFEVASIEDLEKTLQCPVCKEIPLTRIFQCRRGHMICGSCLPHLDTCALCQGRLTKTRNFGLESIIEASKFRCDFHDDGCGKILSGQMLKSHQENCQFRSIQCHFRRVTSGCPGLMIKFSEFLDHLEKIHGLTNILIKDDQVNENNGIKFGQLRNLKLSVSKETHWHCTKVDYDGHTFLTYTFKLGPVIYTSIVIFGDDAAASGYKVKICMKPNSESIEPILSMTLPVLSIRKIGNAYENLQNHITLVVTEGALNQFAEMNTDETRLVWYTNYHIMKSSVKEDDIDEGRRTVATVPRRGSTVKRKNMTSSSITLYRPITRSQLED